MGWGNDSVFEQSLALDLLKNLLRNQKADDLETWYVASGA